MAGTRDNYFRTSDDAILYFEDHSPEKGNPIVLVPGFCCSTRFFENNLKELAKTNRVISFDPRGQGCSCGQRGGPVYGHPVPDGHDPLIKTEKRPAVCRSFSAPGRNF